MELHPFDTAIALEPVAPDRWRGATSDDYWNMVGPFGGIVAAILLRGALDHPDRRGEPAALTVNFCAPLAKGDFTVGARPARTNRSTQHWTMEIRQADGIAATATALFGSRPATFEHRPLAPPDVPGFDQLESLRMPGSGWTQRYDFRFAEGAPDWRGEPADPPAAARSVLWVRSLPPRPLDFVGLAALCDIFFGRIIHVRRQMVPFGTVSMTAFFHASPEDLVAQADRPVLGRADGRIFERGFHDQSAELWSADGRLLATSHQLVYYRDPEPGR